MRVNASRESRILRRRALFSLRSFGFSTRTRCARRATRIYGSNSELNALALRTPFRRLKSPASRIGSSKEQGNTLIGSAVYRLTRIAVRNDVNARRGLVLIGNGLKTELKSPCQNVAVSKL